MTKQRTFKRRVRERMAKTGESYTAARRMLIANGDRPESAAVEFRPPVANARMVEATGRGWQEWFGLLDGWNATSHNHTEIARWLMDEHGVPGWHSQSLTVGYEQARGLRAPGQRKDGFVAGASRTVGVPVERLFEAFTEQSLRELWMPGAELRERTATAPRTARYDWEGGSSRVIVLCESKGEAKSTVALSHERLPDADAGDAMKAWWRERLTELKTKLEAGELEA